METNPVAPADASAPESVATPTTTNEEAAPAAPAPNIPADQVEAFNRFVDNLGGFEKGFKTFKSVIANGIIPKNQEGVDTLLRNDPGFIGGNAVAQPSTSPQQSTEPATQAAPTAPAKPAEGYLSPTDIAALQYTEMLAKKYEPIKDYVSGGQYLKDMAEMGMTPVDAQGNMNDAAIRKFLDMKAQTVPAQSPAAPVTSTPTVDYVQIAENITSMDEALAVIKQNQTLGGVALHPRTEDAKKFIAEHFKEIRKNS